MYIHLFVFLIVQEKIKKYIYIKNKENIFKKLF